MNQTQTEKRARELSKAVAAFSVGYKAKPPPKPSVPQMKRFSYPYESLKIKDGKDGKDGTSVQGPPGKDAVIDMEEIYTSVLERIKKEKVLVISDLKDGQAFVFNNTKYQTHEMMHGGAGASASATGVYSEVVSGSGTSWTLAHTPTSGTVQLYGNGQRLTLTVDYSIVGAAITTVNSFSAGQILADYTY